MRLNAAHFVCLGCVLVCAALQSCSSRPGEVQTYPAAGEMFLAGEPASGARIAFQPASGESTDQWPSGFPRAVVDQAGKFVVETYDEGDGCPAGDYIVLVTWPANLPSEERGEEAETVDRLQGRYATRDASPLKAKVEAKPNELGRYELK